MQADKMSFFFQRMCPKKRTHAPMPRIDPAYPDSPHSHHSYPDSHIPIIPFSYPSFRDFHEALIWY